MKGLLIGLGIVVALGFVIGGSYISAFNYGAEAEQQIVAGYENLENIRGNYALKVAEAAKVPAMQREDLKKVVTAALSARYGADCSKATFQWIKEQNPNIDSSVYKQIQQIIEAGRDKFANAQTQFIDVKRTYQTNLNYFWRGMWLRIAGYPKIDLSKYQTVTSADAKEAFSTGIDKGVTLPND